MTSSICRVGLLLLSTTLAIAQTTGGGTGGGGGSTGGGTTGGGGKPSTGGVGGIGNTRRIPNPQDEMQRPIILTGRVVMDDGSAPPERVSIERVCNGKTRREAYTDSKGFFSITIDNRQPMLMMQDASVGSEGMDGSMRTGLGGLPRSTFGADFGGSMTLTGCELKGVLAGTTSNTIQLTGHRAFDDPNVGTLVMRRMVKTEGTTVSVTSLQAPSGAKKAFDHGRKALDKQKVDEAKAEFEKAVEMYPNYAEAWVELGDIYMKAGDFDKAAVASQKALEADARFLRPYFTLIILSAGKQDWQRTADLSDKLVSLDPYNYPAGFYYNALAHYKLNHLDRADKSIRSAKKLDPSCKLPKVALLMATILMDRSDFEGAAHEFQSFLDHVPEGAEAQYARNALTVAQNKMAGQKN